MLDDLRLLKHVNEPELATIDGRYVGPLDPSDAPELVASIKEGRKALPGRGLEDSDYRLPWGGRA